MSEVLERITRETIDMLIDSRPGLEVKLERRPEDVVDRWWPIKRNGKTRRGRRNPNEIKLPFKAGPIFGKITQDDFLPDGTLNYEFFRRGV